MQPAKNKRREWGVMLMAEHALLFKHIHDIEQFCMHSHVN